MAAAVGLTCCLPKSPPHPPSESTAGLSALAPADPYEDLLPLAAAIGDAQVVALGEPLHAVGNIDEFGARLVAFLHDRLGFTVLAWEAGLWSCETDSTTCLGFPWGNISETAALRKVSETLGMQVTGFDIQFTGPDAVRAEYRLRDDLARIMGSSRSDLVARTSEAFTRLPKAKRFRKMTIAERATDADAFRRALAIVNAAPAAPSTDLVARGVSNVLALYEWHETVKADVSIDMDWAHHTELNNTRDQAMAENVLWLLRNRYPKQKVILWAANMHIARNVQWVEDLRGPEFLGALSKYKTMGTWLADALGKSYYAVAMTARAGQVGNPPDVPVHEIGPSLPGSLEAESLPDSATVRFVDLKREAPSPRRAKFLGLSDFVASWSQIFDGAILFRTVTPATPAQGPASEPATPAVSK